MADMDLKGRVALITGSARGIGRILALSLAKDGASLIINYLKNSRAALSLTNNIRKHGGEAIAIQADVARKDEAARLIREAVRHFDRLDILINNVGPFIEKDLAEVSIEDWQYILATNLHSCFYCSKFALEYMRKQGWGRIVNIAYSGAHHIMARSRIVPYAIAKAGVLILSKSLAQAEAKNGITVNVISPGIMDEDDLSSEERSSWVKKIPSTTLGSPKNLASAISFLVSDKACYITGANLVISGGWQV
jgi:3-oxoacyl-[acyl-carrier protein] reductase